MKIEFTDLTNITRDNKRARTVVYIYNDNYGDRAPWLELGQVEIRNEGKICWLSAYLTEGVSDFEHDSAHALRLPLIGLKFDNVWYSHTYLTAWVDPNNSDDFHVPLPGYNPMKLPDATICKEKHCSDKHPIVPQGYYVPPHNPKLYELVKGKKLEIVIGFKKDETVDS